MKKFFSFLLVFLSLTLLFPTGSIFAGSTVTECVSLLQVKKNLHGNGYEWDNPNDTLTLTNLDLRTEDDYGFKICDGATVILEGNNYIEASKAALYIDGDVVFRGSGTLTLVGGDYGILCNSASTSKKLTITAGTYQVRGGKGGIKSDFVKVHLTGGKFTIHGGSGYAVDAREFQTGGNVTIDATGSFYSSYRMILEAANLQIVSEEAAIIAPKTLSIASMKLRAGDDLKSLSSVVEYSGQKALVTSSTYDEGLKSLLFGDSVSFAVDVLVLVGVLLLLTATIVLPILIRRKRTALAVQARDIAFAEEERIRKQNKKNLKKR